MGEFTFFNAKDEIQKAEQTFKDFLTSVYESGIYIPLNKNFKPSLISCEKEIQNFKSSDLEEKENLIARYKMLYNKKNLNQKQFDMFKDIDITIFLSQISEKGIPVEIEENYHFEAQKYINMLKGMKNIDLCEYKGKPLIEFLSKIQFSETCSKKELEIIKNSFENLKRYNQAIGIIEEIESKAYYPSFKKDESYNIAKKLKTNKGICSEIQLSKVLDAKKRLVPLEPEQIDIFSYLKGEKKSIICSKKEEEIFR